ncbi:MAG: type II secretion system protein [Candidatus Omnitrophota bacterium]
MGKKEARMRVRSNKGFTLAELLISAFIVTITAVGLVGAMSNMAVLNERNRELVFAVDHAQYVLEQINAASFSGLETAITGGSWDLNANTLSANPYNFTVLNNESVATNVVTSGDPLRFAVQINWTDKSGSARSFILETLRTN